MHRDEIRALGPCHIDEEEIGWGSKGLFFFGSCRHLHTRKHAYALTQQSENSCSSFSGRRTICLLKLPFLNDKYEFMHVKEEQLY